jgi:hypothetical protein
MAYPEPKHFEDYYAEAKVEAEEELEELIQLSIQQAEAEERKQKALSDAQRTEFNNLLREASALRLGETENIPRALLPYCEARRGPDRMDTESNIDALKQGWRPDTFVINAPGLMPLGFNVIQDRSTQTFFVNAISFMGAAGSFVSWHQAIAAAAQRHRQEKEWDAEVKRRNAAGNVLNDAKAEPTPAERLESLIREIARGEVEG